MGGTVILGLASFAAATMLKYTTTGPGVVCATEFQQTTTGYYGPAGTRFAYVTSASLSDVDLDLLAEKVRKHYEMAQKAGKLSPGSELLQVSCENIDLTGEMFPEKSAGGVNQLTRLSVAKWMWRKYRGKAEARLDLRVHLPTLVRENGETPSSDLRVITTADKPGITNKKAEAPRAIVISGDDEERARQRKLAEADRVARQQDQQRKVQAIAATKKYAAEDAAALEKLKAEMKKRGSKQ